MVEELVGVVKVQKVGGSILSDEDTRSWPLSLGDHQPRCPECDGPLEKREFVDEYEIDGVTPKEDCIDENWYCPACGCRWLPMEETPYKRPS